MATLTFNGASYDVDHAVKGSDYVHGYDANGTIIISFEGVSDFSVITYNGTYMDPEDCLEEACNSVKHCNGGLVKADGTKLSPADIVREALSVSLGGTGKTLHTSNAVLIGNGAGAVNNVASASGAFYATSENGKPKFGTLPIKQGGTGATTAADALSKLGAAPAEHNHSASSINSGTLSSSRLPTVPVTKGGTGATTKANARKNLGITSGTADPSGGESGDIYFQIKA